MVYPLDGSKPFEDRIIQDACGCFITSEKGISFNYNGSEAIPYDHKTRMPRRKAQYRMEFVDDDPTPADSWKFQIIATTIEQSQELAKLGLNTANADMVWWPSLYACGERWDLFPYRPHTAVAKRAIMAWSLSKLIKEIPETIEGNGIAFFGKADFRMSDNYCGYFLRSSKDPVFSCKSETSIAAVVNVIKWLISRGHKF